MAQRKKQSVWGVLARLGLKGDRGDRDEIIQHVFETTSRLTVRSASGEPIEGGDFLVGVFESLGSAKDWPPVGGREWSRLRSKALGIVMRKLATEGLLDAIAVGAEGVSPAHIPGTSADARSEEGEGNQQVGEGADAGQDSRGGGGTEEMPGLGVEVASAFIRRGMDNPDVGFRCLGRDTPMRIIWRWARETCPDVPPEALVSLKDRLAEVAYRDDDGHLLGAVMLRALEDELDAGSNDERWLLTITYFEDAIDALRRVFERLALL